MSTDIPPSTPVESSPSAIGIFDVFALWWRARACLFVHALLAAVVGAGLLLVVYLGASSQQAVTMGVRLRFNGVERGQYPNGMPFSPQDLVSTSVLQKVYDRNDLGTFIKFEDFKDAFSVLETNVAIERLRRDFDSKLNDKKLTAVERNRVEEEFQGKIRALRNGDFRLVGLLGGRFKTWKPELAGKVLNDIMETWVEESRGRGVFKFDINVFSDNILSDIKQGQDDYLVQIDRLRVTIKRIISNLDRLESVPGSNLVRVGEHNVSLGELRVFLQDDMKFKLGMIQSAIYAFGFYRNRTLSEAYIQDQLFNLQLDRQANAGKIKVVDDALSNYSSNNRAGAGSGGSNQASTGISAGTMIPQLGESFLDRVIDLSTQKADVEYRQNLTTQNIAVGQEMVDIDKERQLYERMLKTLDEVNEETAKRAEMLAWVQSQIDELILGLNRTLVNLQLMHAEVSRRALQPSQIYTVAEPFRTTKISMIGTVKLIAVVGFLGCLYMGLVLVIMAKDLLKKMTV